MSESLRAIDRIKLTMTREVSDLDDKEARAVYEEIAAQCEAQIAALPEEEETGPES